MPVLAKPKKAEPKTIDSFLANIKKRQPALYRSADSSFLPYTSAGKGLVCMTPLEEQLVILHSLAARKYELAVESGTYVTWNESYGIWKQEQYPGMLEQNMMVASFLGDDIRKLQFAEKQRYIADYRNYLLWLEEMTGNSNDPIPEDVLIRAVKLVEFPEIPLMGKNSYGAVYLYSPELKTQSQMMAERKAS